MRAPLSVLCALLIAAAPAMAKKDRASIDLSLPLSLLSGDDGSLTLTCGSAEDSDTGGMIGSLQGTSRGSWQSRDADSRVTATRRSGKFRLRAWEDGTKTLDLKLPWKVAECLFGGRDGETVDVDIDSIQAKGGLHLLLAGDRAELGISVD